MDIIQPYERQLNAMQKAMPTRPLTLKNVGESLLVKILYILLGLATLTIMLYNLNSEIASIQADREIAKNPIDVPTAVVSGSCKKDKLPFMHSCDIVIANAGIKVKRQFSFVDTGDKAYGVKVLAQKDNPQNMNVDWATQYVTKQIIARLIWLLIAVTLAPWLIYVYAKEIFINYRLKKIFNTPNHQPWELVALPIEPWAGFTMQYDMILDGKPTTKRFIYNERGKNRFWLGSEDNLVVAIKAKDTETYLPLLYNLKNIDLSKDEKQALLKAYNTIDIVVPNKKPK